MKKTLSIILTILTAAGVLFAADPPKHMTAPIELAAPVAGEYIGEVHEVKPATGEIFIKKKSRTLDVQVFDKLYNKEGDRFILLNIDTPYITVIKCRVAKNSDFALIQKGMKFYRYYPGCEKKVEAPAEPAGNAGDVKTIGGIEMVYIPAGSFLMGTAGNTDSEYQHKVSLDAFYMGKYDVTQAQYEAVMGTNPSKFKGKPNNPVETVSWYDAVEFCNKLSIKTGRSPYYTINGTNVTIHSSANGFRLPTEAEWEYACRAGTTTTYYWGESTDFSVVDQYAVYEENSYKKGASHPDYGTHRVGSKKPNAFGLYDMNGNVYQWCWDWYGSDYYKTSPAKNPLGAAAGTYRVLRGGSWVDFDVYLRSPRRGSDNPGSRSYFLGFRLVAGVR